MSISNAIWAEKYRFDGETAVHHTWQRVARALAAVEEPQQRKVREDEFYHALKDFRFLPGGRILAGAGTGRRVTLFNCFAMGAIPDSLEGIFNALNESARTMQQGGGIGLNFSTLRPKGAHVHGVDADASGPVSFMRVWDAMCRTIMSAGARRGAMMGVLRCDHPDIVEFVSAKKNASDLRMFNLSVLVTDAFMRAVADDTVWELKFEGCICGTIRAQTLWELITQTAYECAEPGVIFIDTVNELNPLNDCETLAVTNPCAELPLPEYGACLLGSINLAALVKSPFTDAAGISAAELGSLAATAVRMLDNAIDASEFPLSQHAAEAHAKRRIGIGITGLADALAMCCLHYGATGARERAARWMEIIAKSAAAASTALGAERGIPPLIGGTRRNGILTAIAPTGTISLLAGNVSSGIEPIFAHDYERRVLNPDGSHRMETVTDYAVRRWRELHSGEKLPAYFVTAEELAPDLHIEMQAALQPHVEAAISKTINCPADIPLAEFRKIYALAHERGLKGCTVYRPNSITGAVLSTKKKEAPAQKAYSPAALPERERVLRGVTYKLRWQGYPHSLYVTINDRDGAPFEIFINSKNLDHYAWTVALTRMVSAVFRRGGDVSFVAEELRAVFDPRGGQWADGRYVPSLLAAIGDIVAEHMGIAADTPQGGKPCTNCPTGQMAKHDGCWECTECGYTSCY